MFSFQAIGLLSDNGDYDVMVHAKKVGMSNDALGMENP